MKDKILITLFCGFITITGLLGLIVPDLEISKSERRHLQQFPNFKLSSLWIKDVDKYLLDHFPKRDTFRSIKANYNYKILNKLDNNKIYIKDKYIFKSEYPTNKKSIKNFSDKVKILNNLLTTNNNTYMMIIPDKNYYLKSKDFLKIDYNYLYNEIHKLGLKDIDVTNLLQLEDYYETDTHWKQENLEKVIKHLSKEMNFNYKTINYQKQHYNNFYGVYYGESALKRSPETLTYLTNDLLDNVNVNYLENKKLHNIYNIKKLKSLDSYNVFLDGASSFIEIENKASTNSKELVIFRDSFGSSLVPLLVNYYSKITVIDNRYIGSNLIKNKVTFNNQDVLFMYSTLLINNSFSMKG